ncbi:MAG: 50S ribosomal protein L9 [uncultured bacterium]|nr:MAG: 50S ribosomal protein L9 [uncultured bacterium]OGN56501.1 MAG: 50S ribosomal protein L9 [Chlamydiae bacterium RIFCSPHIGHO2_01_FULL_44_39]OGN57025.1 MAG: 50S ribosomal protein L9 [Chlamydiae bacterium RIFCSPHIGHO2_02_FULL_45_9]OGN61005.1 MAG: 50S ribosomal protein L9 [Chlamydiae bacterium RIFCSPHIGHO2_12_FULL_44_59]OGN66781.1 MAG: 50S ribosomal protein L9 [Chlamydiae bacterium RIFCSPLOWO2_01_FULL_44_52]OGN69975.1 MAG: 50S ribosomal protein L9 [Chlamydiae bacterium RIFCSPLOWO2_02_FULL_45
MKQQLLLLKDVDSLGKKGELVTARPGYMRNFLFPQGLAVVATENTLRKQERLRKERAEQAVIDRKESEEMAILVEGAVLEIFVKVDPEGHMYGSVSRGDIADLFHAKGLVLEKKAIQLTKPIKMTGKHKLSIKLKEGVMAICDLHIIPEGVAQIGVEEVTAPIPSGEAKQKEDA